MYTLRREWETVDKQLKKITEQVKTQTIFQAALQCEIKLQLIRLDPLSFLDPGMTGNYDVLLYTSKTSEVLPKIKNKQLPPNKQKHSPKTHNQKQTNKKNPAKIKKKLIHNKYYVQFIKVPNF